ncbi:MAG: transcription-repair coupling factor [Magnetococcales bacterium]|nr:transcription-repair coupling factor [Magnetococcales bacterium]
MDSSASSLSSLLTPLRPLIGRSKAFHAPLSGVAGGAVGLLGALLGGDSSTPLVMVCGKTSRAESLLRELLFYTKHLPTPPQILSFPAWETLPFERLSPFGPLVADRLNTLFRLNQMRRGGPVSRADDEGHPRTIVLTTPMSLMQRVIPGEVLGRRGFAVAVGDRLNLPAFRAFLAASGYRNAAQVEEPGEFAVRGGIIDLFPPGREEPVRIELFGDDVESLRIFDPGSQRSGDHLRRLDALPVCEVILDEESIARFRTQYRSAFGGASSEDPLYKALSKGEKFQGMEQYLPLFYEKPESFFDYLPAGTLFLLEPEAQAAADERAREILEQHRTLIGEKNTARCLPPDSLYLSLNELEKRFAPFSRLRLQEEYPGREGAAMGFTPSPDFFREKEGAARVVVETAAAALRGWLKKGYLIAVSARTVGQRERLWDLLGEQRLPLAESNTWGEAMQATHGYIRLVLGDVARGFLHEKSRVALITEEEILGPRHSRNRKDRRFIEQLMASFADLQDGDLVVHADHGIGRYGGLTSLSVGNIRNDFLLITYAGDDKLYVPVENLDRVSKYLGSDEAVLDRLGSPRWAKTKEKARRRILEMAGDLVMLQAKREHAQGFAFTPPDAIYQEFAASFPFEETPDQAQAIEAVLDDMASPRPMDRLVCGDVGFGKTEVALRAAFRAVTDGKQVAVLAPTTILVQQHYETFTRRMGPYGVRVAPLSRMRTNIQTKESVEAAARGEVDILIGTHRLLQDDIAFRDLGLLVVDEEQRFGVGHKEKLKKLRASVDILTLTATPIPRTLNMAMAGVRDISIIASPPPDRLSIRTIITQHERQLVREAILREIYRAGQVFYVHNEVEDIEAVAASLAELVPEARVGIAHGQMRENQLEKVMLSFYHQEFNVLVCTTIIENGVDIPSANTIIIDRADRFGLAQLHQLRGRVGRSKHRGYAYFLIPHPQRLSEDARKRLDAVETLGDLGAGFMLATHDMEIRGAGNMLGEDQSGEIKEVGYELYREMLEDAIKALRSGHVSPSEGPSEEEIVPTINLGVSTFIPQEYVEDINQRLTLYKRIAGMSSPDEVTQMEIELTDRFGKPPIQVRHLLQVMRLKGECKKLKIVKLEAGPKGGVIQFHPKTPVQPTVILDMIHKERGFVRFTPDKNAMSLINRPWEDPDTRIRELEKAMEKFM